jgi:hypothetical protein
MNAYRSTVREKLTDLTDEIFGAFLDVHGLVTVPLAANVSDVGGYVLVDMVDDETFRVGRYVDDGRVDDFAVMFETTDMHQAIAAARILAGSEIGR